MAASIELGRAAYERQDWAEAYALLAETATEPEDLERLAVAAELSGDGDASLRIWERAHIAATERAQRPTAARTAFWLGLLLSLRGEPARAGGWFARAERELETSDTTSAHGLVLVPRFLEAIEGGDPTVADALASEILEVASMTRDRDVLALGLLCRGEALVALGDVPGGTRAFDEAMVAVTTGETSPLAAGIVYCAVIAACMELLDLARATEWTDALEDWCSTQSESAPFRGVCLVHRAEILSAHGAWEDAIEAAERATQRLAEIRHPAVGQAWYQLGELYRLRGSVEAAEAAYDAASTNGRDPSAGLALLRASQGRSDDALATVERMLDEHRGSPTRAAVLAAAVDVRLDAGALEAARAASEELDAVARTDDKPLLSAIAAYARGSVLLADDEAQRALPELRRACEGWRRLGMPYDAARARAQIARACATVGDRDASTRELDAARAELARLGAQPDLERLDAEAAARPSVPLTDRECEVLRLVATGQTNREIASELIVSEHTVGRHLQNIFKKIDVSSRAAATAYAYEHDLV